MKVKVYHCQAKDEHGRSAWEGFQFPADYKHVGTIEVKTDEVWRVFELTNHTGMSWTINSEVVELPDGPQQRSTSVNDAIMLPSGSVHRCLPCGWGPLQVDTPLLCAYHKDVRPYDGPIPLLPGDLNP